jgi:hypothetical protein
MSIAPGIVNLTFAQGSTWKLSLTYTNADALPIDLTNYSARMQARTFYDSPVAALSLTSGAGITLGGTAGTVDLLVDAVTTAQIDSGTYVYDLEVESQSGEVVKIIAGGLTVLPEATR